MYTFYFQSVPSLGGNMFRLTAHNTGAAAPLGALYSEDRLRSIVRSGYRVVIDPTPAALKELNETSTEKYPLQLALGFRAIYPPTMFAIPRFSVEFQTDKLPATLPSNSGDILRYMGPSDFCGQDVIVPAEQDGEFDKQASRLETTIGREHYFTFKDTGSPSAGPLPPQAPLAPTEKVDEYGVPKSVLGSMLLPPTFVTPSPKVALFRNVHGDRCSKRQNASEEKPQGFWAWLSEIFGFDNTDES